MISQSTRTLKFVKPMPSWTSPLGHDINPLAILLGARTAMLSICKLPRIYGVLKLACILVALAIAGILSGCSSSTPAPTFDPVTPLSVEQRDEIVARLDETLAANSLTLLKSNEPQTICSNYERANWDIDRVLDPLLEKSKDDADVWRDYHIHFTLLLILMDQMERSGLSVKQQIDQAEEWLRAFCGSL